MKKLFMSVAFFLMVSTIILMIIVFIISRPTWGVLMSCGAWLFGIIPYFYFKIWRPEIWDSRRVSSDLAEIIKLEVPVIDKDRTEYMLGLKHSPFEPKKHFPYAGSGGSEPYSSPIIAEPPVKMWKIMEPEIVEEPNRAEIAQEELEVGEWL